MGVTNIVSSGQKYYIYALPCSRVQQQRSSRKNTIAYIKYIWSE